MEFSIHKAEFLTQVILLLVFSVFPASMSYSCAKDCVNTQGIRGMALKCLCGRDVSIFTSKTQDNPGRPFFRCPTMREEHLFKWVEEAVFEEVEDNLPKLGLIENELRNVKSEVEEMKALAESLKNDVQRGKLIHKIWCVSICLIVFVIVVVWGGKTTDKQLMVGYCGY